MSKTGGYFTSLFGRRTKALLAAKSMIAASRHVNTEPQIASVTLTPPSSAPIPPASKPAPASVPIKEGVGRVSREPSARSNLSPPEARIVVEKRIVERVVEKVSDPMPVSLPLQPEISSQPESSAPTQEVVALPTESLWKPAQPIDQPPSLPLEQKLETVVVWPPQLNPEQRTVVRKEIARTVRERVAREPRLKSDSHHNLEIRVDQVNVRLEAAPQPPHSSPQKAMPEASFGEYFFNRSLR
jgi:hypothetical protein